MWRAALLGDSLVRHLVPSGRRPVDVFRLQKFDIRVHGISGASVRRWSSMSTAEFQRSFGWLRNYRPHVILLAIGTNDLCDHNVLPRSVHLAMLEVIYRLLAIAPAFRVVILPILPRYSTGPGNRQWVNVDLDTFNNRVHDVNILSRLFAQAHGKVIYWEHIHRHLRVEGAYVADGVHMSESGKRRLVQSLRHALMFIEDRVLRQLLNGQ